MSDPNVRETISSFIEKGWLEITDPDVTVEDLDTWPEDKPLPLQPTQAAREQSDRRHGDGQSS